MNTTSKTPWTDHFVTHGPRRRCWDSFVEEARDSQDFARKLEAAYHEAVEALEHSKEALRVGRNDAAYEMMSVALTRYATLQREMEGREG